MRLWGQDEAHEMDEKELYRELGALTKRRQEWRENISWVGALLDHASPKVVAKALWLLGEMGLRHPVEVEPFVGKVASFLEFPEELLRERALNALGRIGRGRFESVEPFWKRMSGLGRDVHPRVRLAFVWASENIATQTPDPYGDCLPLFAKLLHDTDDRVRMEAPEMFRVLGKRRPQMVEPYLDTLRRMAENDPHPVVRIHCSGAVRAVGKERDAGFSRTTKIPRASSERCRGAAAGGFSTGRSSCR